MLEQSPDLCHLPTVDWFLTLSSSYCYLNSTQITVLFTSETVLLCVCDEAMVTVCLPSRRCH